MSGWCHVTTHPGAFSKWMTPKSPAGDPAWMGPQSASSVRACATRSLSGCGKITHVPCSNTTQLLFAEITLRHNPAQSATSQLLAHPHQDLTEAVLSTTVAAVTPVRVPLGVLDNYGVARAEQ